jgi:hypothetical protein
MYTYEIIRQREIYTNLTLNFYKKVSQISYNKEYHKVKLVKKSKCNEHIVPDCGMISPHGLLTPSNQLESRYDVHKD